GATCPSGACTVTLNVGGAQQTFTINVTVPTGGGGGGGGGGGNGGGGGGANTPQMTIVSGDGQLLQSGFASAIQDPLTVLVTGADGKPLSNVDVAFSVTSGTLSTVDDTVKTNSSGLASTTLRPTNVQAAAPGY